MKGVKKLTNCLKVILFTFYYSKALLNHDLMTIYDLLFKKYLKQIEEYGLLVAQKVVWHSAKWGGFTTEHL